MSVTIPAKTSPNEKAEITEKRNTRRAMPPIDERQEKALHL